MSDAQAVTAALARVVAARIGRPGDVSALTRLTGGATKATWAFDAWVGAASEPLILQQSFPRPATPGDPMAALPRIAGADEAALLGLAAKAAIPVPTVRATLAPEDGLGVGVIMDRLDGETLGARIARDARFGDVRPALAAQCGHILAALHRIDSASAPFLVEHGPSAQLALYRAIYESFDHPQPALELAFRWAATHAPVSAPTAVVHGDFRNGNFIVGADGIRAVLDWELAHFGDPIEDLGWLCVKSWRFGVNDQRVGGFGAVEDLLTSYRSAGGREFDLAELRFWEAMGTLKWGVICEVQAFTHLQGAVRSVELATLGRRVAEMEWDLLELIEGEA